MARSAHSQLTLFDAVVRNAPVRGGRLLVLPDGPRVEERLRALLAETPLVVGKPACTLAELENVLVQGARARGSCPKVATAAELSLVFAQAAQERTPPGSHYSRLREAPAFAQAVLTLSRTLVQARLVPEELPALVDGLEASARGK
ncbi:MAG: hypothetical protein JST92_27960, partial [Deltaproteobacteria bacterium]|nr:hypothetical protein [Deltaproteobacteria bacterium]